MLPTFYRFRYLIFSTANYTINLPNTPYSSIDQCDVNALQVPTQFTELDEVERMMFWPIIFAFVEA